MEKICKNCIYWKKIYNTDNYVAMCLKNKIFIKNEKTNYIVTDFNFSCNKWKNKNNDAEKKCKNCIYWVKPSFYWLPFIGKKMIGCCYKSNPVEDNCTKSFNSCDSFKHK